jgi:integrase/recombinase XerD
MNLIGEFKQWLMEEGKADKTIESYVGDIEGFQRYFGEKAVDVTQPLSRFAFVRYKQNILDEKFAVATIKKRSTASRCTTERRMYAPSLI